MTREELKLLIQKTFTIPDWEKQKYIDRVNHYPDWLVKKVYSVIIKAEKKWYDTITFRVEKHKQEKKNQLTQSISNLEKKECINLDETLDDILSIL